jgi:RimJ/RimL family protein N-acetyltransferase
MRIRAAVPGDIPQIVAIEQIPEFRSYIGAWSAEEHGRTMADADAEYFVALSDQQVLHGFAILQGLNSEHHSIHLKRLAVQTPNRGLGRTLLEFVTERVFLHHRAHRFWLDVFETNARARHIYEGYGFRYDGLLRDAILRDGEYHTLVLMSLLEHEYAARQPQVAGPAATLPR